MEKGDALPFFEVATVTGGTTRYADLWQKRNVLVVCLPSAATPEDQSYTDALRSHSAELEMCSAECIVTRERIAGMPAPAVAIADRWGEVQYLACPSTTRELPDVRELLDTLDYVHRRCPECEGEWR